MVRSFAEREDGENRANVCQGVQRLDARRVVAGNGGRLILLTIVSCGTQARGRGRYRRNATRGVRAVCFSEIPPFLGLPSDPRQEPGYWDPFFDACNETGTVINMHIGSSSKMPSTSADAPPAVGSTLTFTNAAMSHDRLVDAAASSRASRACRSATAKGRSAGSPTSSNAPTRCGKRTAAGAASPTRCSNRRRTYHFHKHVSGCFFDDPHGLRSLDSVGVDNVTFETDYPHSDSTWPHTKKVAEELMKDLTQEQVNKICRDNAIRMLHLDLARS